MHTSEGSPLSEWGPFSEESASQFPECSKASAAQLKITSRSVALYGRRAPPPFKAVGVRVASWPREGQKCLG